jgi:tRNA(fMet)-specific endonuclease VapC
VKRYLLDTGIMGEFINHRKGVDVKAREARQRGARLGTGLPVVGELFFGVEASATRDANLPKLKRALSGIICWPFDRAAAEEYGRLAAELKRLGRPMQQIDIQAVKPDLPGTACPPRGGLSQWGNCQAA